MPISRHEFVNSYNQINQAVPNTDPRCIKITVPEVYPSPKGNEALEDLTG